MEDEKVEEFWKGKYQSERSCNQMLFWLMLASLAINCIMAIALMAHL